MVGLSWNGESIERGRRAAKGCRGRCGQPGGPEAATGSRQCSRRVEAETLGCSGCPSREGGEIKQDSSLRFRDPWAAVGDVASKSIPRGHSTRNKAAEVAVTATRVKDVATRSHGSVLFVLGRPKNYGSPGDSGYIDNFKQTEGPRQVHAPTALRQSGKARQVRPADEFR
jgi:hypothetical protein